MVSGNFRSVREEFLQPSSDRRNVLAPLPDNPIPNFQNDRAEDPQNLRKPLELVQGELCSFCRWSCRSLAAVPAGHDLHMAGVMPEPDAPAEVVGPGGGRRTTRDSRATDARTIGASRAEGEPRHRRFTSRFTARKFFNEQGLRVQYGEGGP
jgi:hypothetical protein